MWFLISGILFGIIAGMGMGGGIILIPVLTILLGVDQQGAQGLNLLCFLPMAGFALDVYKRQNKNANGSGPSTAASPMASFKAFRAQSVPGSFPGWRNLVLRYALI